jgi:hypothetical protein
MHVETRNQFAASILDGIFVLKIFQEQIEKNY